MVVFTCNHCGDSLQKPKVEKHYQTVCRRVKSLTCVDCFKDFHGEDFTSHIKCITEEERYAAKGSIPGGIVKKGEAKQESWVDMIRSIISIETNLTPKVKNLLETVANQTNTPRKKHKFMNFIKSSSGGRVDMKAVEEVWNLIEKYKAQTVKANPESVKENKEEENNGKRKLDDDETEASEIKKIKTEDNGVEKKKDKKNKSEKMIVDSEENGVEKKKKKKNKSEKMIVDSEENGVKNEKCEEQNGTVEENTDKKKKKKGEVSEENGIENKQNGTVEDTTGKKKKKKGKKNKNNSQNGVETSESKTELLDNNDETIVKSKKKKNKNNDKENVNDDGAENKLNGSKNTSDDVESENKLNGNNESEIKETEIFSYEETIMNIMKEKKNISLKKLQKKVLNSFVKHHGLTEATDKHAKKFMKKLNKMETVKLDSDNVILIE